MTDWEISKALGRMPVEVLLVAMAQIPDQLVLERLRRYLTEIRHRTISITGDDVHALGLKRSPAVGRVLEKVREMRVEGLIQGREVELMAARRLVEDAE
jgi:hypothetical protein